MTEGKLATMSSISSPRSASAAKVGACPDSIAFTSMPGCMASTTIRTSFLATASGGPGGPRASGPRCGAARARARRGPPAPPATTGGTKTLSAAITAAASTTIAATPAGVCARHVLDGRLLAARGAGGDVALISGGRARGSRTDQDRRARSARRRR